jgi:ADP-heptose:LPS heptosyltransferase/uncharacterized membrane protein YbhN (UPF0104 family)
MTKRFSTGFWIRLIFTLAFLGWLGSRIDWPSVVQGLRTSQPLWFLLAAFLLMLSSILAGLRWAILMKKAGFRQMPMLRWQTLYFAGSLINQGLPTVMGGDSFRAWQAARPHKAALITPPSAPGFRLAIGTVVLDRTLGLIGNLMLGCLGLISLTSGLFEVASISTRDAEYSVLRDLLFADSTAQLGMTLLSLMLVGLVVLATLLRGTWLKRRLSHLLQKQHMVGLWSAIELAYGFRWILPQTLLAVSIHALGVTAMAACLYGIGVTPPPRSADGDITGYRYTSTPANQHFRLGIARIRLGCCSNSVGRTRDIDRVSIASLWLDDTTSHPTRLASTPNFTHSTTQDCTMNVDTMRRVDYWAGIPLCALLTPLVWLLDRLRNRSTDKPQRLLFIELSEMGSAVIADPAMRLARDRGAELFFLIFASNRHSLGLLNTVAPQNILTIRVDSLFTLAFDTLRVLWTIHRLNIDTVIDLELFSRFTALLTGLSGAERRVGYHSFHNEGLWRGNMLTHKVPCNPHIHIAKNFIALIEAAFADTTQAASPPYGKFVVSDAQTELAQVTVPPEEKIALTERIQVMAQATGIEWQPGKQYLILINANASELLPQRRWAPERFAALIAQLAQQLPDALFLLTGSANENTYVDTVKRDSQIQRVINFAGAVKFGELPTLYTIADLMVTNDSGPGHFAAVTPLQTIVLFGPETPKLYGSLGKSVAITANLACSPCVSASNHRKTPCSNNLCMQAIEVEQVADQVLAVLPTQPVLHNS